MDNATQGDAVRGGASYPMYYVTAWGFRVCAGCAESPPRGMAMDAVVSVHILWTGKPVRCDNCGHAVEAWDAGDGSVGDDM